MGGYGYARLSLLWLCSVLRSFSPRLKGPSSSAHLVLEDAMAVVGLAGSVSVTPGATLSPGRLCSCRPYSPSSALRTSTLGRTPSAFANLKIVLTVGFRTPRSMPDT